jgi:hypothetical protein
VAEEDGLGVELFQFRLRLAPAGEALFAGDLQCRFALDRRSVAFGLVTTRSSSTRWK